MVRKFIAAVIAAFLSSLAAAQAQSAGPVPPPSMQFNGTPALNDCTKVFSLYPPLLADSGVSCSGGGGTQVLWVGTLGGSANAYTLTASGFVLTDQYTIAVKIATSNTGASTLAINGGSAISIEKQNSSGTPIALANGDLVAGSEVDFQYQTACNCWVLKTQLGQQVITTSSNYAVTAANWAAGDWIVVTASSVTVTLPQSSTLSQNGGVAVQAPGNSVTLALANAGDVICSSSCGSAGASVTIAAGQGGLVTTNSTGNFYATGIASGGGSGTVTSVAVGGGLTTTSTGASCGSGATITTSGTLYGCHGINAQTTSYTAAAGDLGKVIAFTLSGSAVLTLPNSPVLAAGWYAIVSVTGNSLSITHAGSTLYGCVGTLATGTGVVIGSDGTNYWCVGGAVSQPTAGDVLTSTASGNTFNGIAPVNGDCLVGNATPAWAAGSCTGGLNRSSGCGTLPTSATTKYCPFSGEQTSTASFGGVVVQLAPLPVTSFTIWCAVSAAPGTGNSTAFQLVDNGTPIGPTCTISNSATSASATASGTIAAGDQVAYQVVGTGTPAAATGWLAAN